MKITKLMLSAFVAAIALVACNKIENDQNDGSLQTVRISLENVITTKGPAGDKIAPDANGKMPVNVNNIKIFLTDGAYSPAYSAQDVNGAVAQTYFNLTGENAVDLTQVLEFHYVDHKCNKVVVVANVPENTTLNDIKNNSGSIADQQDQDRLILWAESNLQATGKYHTNEETGKHTEVYEASLTLKPVISRFEVDGFRVAFSDPAKFDKIEVTAIGFSNYYETLNFSVEGGLKPLPSARKMHVAAENVDNESAVFNWFNNSTEMWYLDKFTGLEMTPTAPAADCESPRAYHFFSGNAIPTMFITLLADGNPAYIYAEEYISPNGSITTLEPGKIYRMSAAGEVPADSPDGSIEIPDDLDPIERCININVQVVDWVVELVTPQF